jgi:RNA polymerase sigma-70 factor, ECF subfamily
MSNESQDLTRLLSDWHSGDREAGNQLIQAVYGRLHRLASHYLRREPAGHELETTALVNELYVKLFSSEPVQWHDRGHFFAVAAKQLRRILVDYAREIRAEKRGGGFVKIPIAEAIELAPCFRVDFLEISEALGRLEELDPRAAAGIELRFYAGLKETEIAELLGISIVTLHRDWRVARAWLISQLQAKPVLRNPQ